MPSPTVYVERTYPLPPEEVIRYVPIEPAPEVSPAEPTAAPPPAESLLEQGHSLFHQGRYDEARRLYTRALLAEGKNPAAQLSYGLAHFALGQYSVAAMATRRALEADPDLMDAPPDPRGLYGDGAAFEAQLQTLRDTVAQRSQDAQAILVLAWFEYAIGHPGAALEHLDHALTLDPTDTLVHILRDAVVRTATAHSEGESIPGGVGQTY